jgi:hypothetical protein
MATYLVSVRLSMGGLCCRGIRMRLSCSCRRVELGLMCCKLTISGKAAMVF